MENTKSTRDATHVIERWRHEPTGNEADIRWCESDPEDNPLEGEDLCEVVALHDRKYRLGHIQVDPEELDRRVAAAEEDGRDVRWFDIYEHSGIKVTLSGGRTDPWDTRRGGAILMTKDAAALERRRIRTEADATAWIGTLLANYNRWLNNECLEAVFYEVKRCDLGHLHHDETHRIGHFLGIDTDECGIREESGLIDATSKAPVDGWKLVARMDMHGRLAAAS